MAGASVSTEVDSREVMAALNRLVTGLQQLTPALRDIGEMLQLSHDQRFKDQKSPEGAPWAPLSDAYKKTKAKHPDRLLLLEGYLSGGLSYQIQGKSLLFGTNSIYGASHQFGRAEAAIPARPWLGLSGNDETEVLEILQEHLGRAAGR